MITALTLATVAGHAGGFGWGFPWFLIFVPLLWIGIFALIASLVGRRFRRRGFGPGGWNGSHPGFGAWQSAQTSRGAESTLAERFAQGDIDEVEYRARLEVLRANRVEPQAPTA